MANSITVTTIQAGPQRTVLHAVLVADGSGEFSAATLLNASSLGITKTAKVMDVKANLNGFSAQLLFKATTNVPFFAIPSGHFLHQCMDGTTGIANPNGAGTTGDILITSNGVSTTPGVGHITITLRND